MIQTATLDDDHVRCPYCGHGHRDPHEYFSPSSEGTEVECDECGQRFMATRIFTVTYRSSPVRGGPCERCAKRQHADGSPITWKCTVCGALTCRGCTQTIPGSVPTEYYQATLCSKECWEKAGRPES